jgi:bifunctional DNA-binding transcriptional regulator/antitoxin component of YhaV-PrlF toxin-antitoxin module
MEKVVPVSLKGQVVIPAPIRKKLKIGRAVLMRDEGDVIFVEASSSIEESFGSGGHVMVDVARDISRDRRREVRSEHS